MVDPPDRVKKGDKLYLVQVEKNKFWEVWNIGTRNLVRYGKWNNGEEGKVVEGSSKYLTQENALNRALELCLLKIDNGYLVLKSENTEKERVFNRFASLIHGTSNDNVVIDLE
jgi:predicted DNA-binding WGR domain protein